MWGKNAFRNLLLFLENLQIDNNLKAFHYQFEEFKRRQKAIVQNQSKPYFHLKIMNIFHSKNLINLDFWKHWALQLFIYIYHIKQHKTNEYKDERSLQHSGCKLTMAVASSIFWDDVVDTDDVDVVAVVVVVRTTTFPSQLQSIVSKFSLWP